MTNRTYRLREYVSLYLNCVIVLMVFLASIWTITNWTPSGSEATPALGAEALKYFTVDSNLLMGATALLLAVRKAMKLIGRPLPGNRFFDYLHLTAVTGVTLTFLVVLFFLSPSASDGGWAQYQRSNLLYHLLVPVLALLDFLFFADSNPVRWPWGILIGLLPEIIYGCYYCIPLFLSDSPDGIIANDLDWYGLFRHSKQTLIPRLTIIVAAFVIVCHILWLLSILRNRHREKRLKERSKSTDYNSISNNLISSVVTASEYYLTKVLRIISVIAPLTGISAAIVFTILSISGIFTFSFWQLLVFDIICASYLVIALFMINTCIGPDGIVITSKVRFGKIILTAVLLLQWNMISYMAPFRDFWAYSLLFLLLIALFLDSRLVLFNAAALILSMVISAFLNGEELLPAAGNTFTSSIVFRITLVFLGFVVAYLLVRLVEHILMDTLDRRSDYDALTHVLNRRQLSHRISDAVDQFRADGSPFCVAILDLDDFKAVNDTYGHMRGDDVLVDTVRVINASVSTRDYVFRHGGEEFLVLYGCEMSSALESCRRILRGIREIRFPFFREGQHQTATIGLAPFEEGMTEETLLMLADERLYSGKQNGKDQIISA